MMKFMKRALSLLISAMLLLGCFALAEEAPLLPIAIVSYDLTDEATTAALSALMEPRHRRRNAGSPAGGHDRHRLFRHRAGPLGERKGHLRAVEHSGQDAV